MIEKTFTVAKVDNTLVTFALPKPQACSGCDGKCGSLTFAKLFANKRSELTIESETPLEIGQKVDLALDDSHVIKMSLLTYMMPLLLALIFTIVAANVFVLTELWQVLFAIFGGYVGFLLAKAKQKGLKNRIKIKKIHPISLPITQINGD
ncbi:SoxR reducing system RseC family protein [Pseudoalteromonas sp. G4]|uniref:SoxR reducing system RseC family protein n=1 Tax=Pseudoalteromonas sp. G4 TaxID=2992761 RepID=UPI00237DA937|nr:SoxR reducing system RseC family protein [Pseudoalteromonas sp. G4]MDE3271670.1 SoxR reducing system RseC family protein [Pseudoalteromonas sp. G4]